MNKFANNTVSNDMPTTPTPARADTEEACPPAIRSAATRYESAYMLHFNKLTKDVQAKVTAAKGQDTSDRDVRDFIRNVIATAQSSE